jgi:hypothetical protein
MNQGWDEIKTALEKDCLNIYQRVAVFTRDIAQLMKVIDAFHQRQRYFSPHTWTKRIGFYVN